MIRPATKAIEAAFKAHDVKFNIHEFEDSSAVETGFGFETFSYTIIFFSYNDDMNVHVASELLRVPEEKRQDILPVLNKINSRGRYFSFSIDEDGDVYAQFDFPINTPIDALGEMAFEIFMRSANIFEDVYPQLMKVVWG